jgi:Fic family protein
VDHLFAYPIMTVRQAQKILSMSQPGATNLLRTLTDLGILREVGVDRPGRPAPLVRGRDPGGS